MSDLKPNKIIVGDETILDLTNDTVNEDTVLQGEIFHDASGQIKVGRATLGNNGLAQFSDVNDIPSGYDKPFEWIGETTSDFTYGYIYKQISNGDNWICYSSSLYIVWVKDKPIVGDVVYNYSYSQKKGTPITNAYGTYTIGEVIDDNSINILVPKDGGADLNYLIRKPSEDHLFKVVTYERIDVQPSGSGSDINVIDNLTSDSSTDALSAKQGKVLKNMIPTREVMPEVTVDDLGSIVQYIGEDTYKYKNGYFYKVVAKEPITYCAYYDSNSNKYRYTTFDNIDVDPSVCYEIVDNEVVNTFTVGDYYFYNGKIQRISVSDTSGFIILMVNYFREESADIVLDTTYTWERIDVQPSTKIIYLESIPSNLVEVVQNNASKDVTNMFIYTTSVSKVTNVPQESTSFYVVATLKYWVEDSGIVGQPNWIYEIEYCSRYSSDKYVTEITDLTNPNSSLKYKKVILSSSDAKKDQVLTFDGTNWVAKNVKFEETDPTVPKHVKAITEQDIENWNTKGNDIDLSIVNGELNQTYDPDGDASNETTNPIALDSTLQSANQKLDAIADAIGNIGGNYRDRNILVFKRFDLETPMEVVGDGEVYLTFYADEHNFEIDGYKIIAFIPLSITNFFEVRLSKVYRNAQNRYSLSIKIHNYTNTGHGCINIEGVIVYERID